MCNRCEFHGRSLEKRFWEKVDKTGDCWLWTAMLNTGGYGLIRVARKMVFAHRLAFEMVRGPIPDGLFLDHLCRVRHCVNPDHLEVVTMRENVLRGIGPTAKQAAQSHCLRGHPFEGENLRIYRGKRICRACVREAWQRRDKQKRERRAFLAAMGVQG